MFGAKDLSGGEVVRQTYEKLVKNLKGEPQRLPRELCLVIADDSDWHRSRTGYMKYEAGHLVSAGAERWFLAVGETWGDYPARPYACDLMALKISWDWNGPEDVRAYFDSPLGAMEKRGMFPFRNSLLVAMASGALATPDRLGRLGERVKAALSEPEMQAHLVQPVERDPRYLEASTLQQVVSKPARYSSKIVDPLAAKLIAILSE